MGAQVLILPDARADLDEAAEFYDDLEPGLGSEVYHFLRQQLLGLGSTAGLHPKNHGVYRYVVRGRFPYYIAYYRFEADLVTVAAVIDCRRDPEFNHRRLQARF